MMVMLMALAAMDTLTGYAPYHAVTVSDFFCTWLGLKKNPLPRWSKKALISCGQFAPFDLLNQLNWAFVEQARNQGVGMVPDSPGIDLILPFEDSDGNCGAFVIQEKNAKAFEIAFTEQNLLFYSRKLQATAPHGAKIIPVIISLNHGNSMKETNSDSGAFVSICPDLVSGKFTLKEYIKFTPDNTLNQTDSFASIIKSLEDDSLRRYMQHELAIANFKIDNVDSSNLVRSLLGFHDAIGMYHRPNYHLSDVDSGEESQVEAPFTPAHAPSAALAPPPPIFASEDSADEGPQQ